MIMLDTLDALILLVESVSGPIKSRTTVQKLLYFTNKKGITNISYRPHYYGPYSSEVAATLNNLIQLNFIASRIETKKSTGYEVDPNWKRYSYDLTEDGTEVAEEIKKEHPLEYQKLKEIVGTCDSEVRLNPTTLSWAAKVDYIVSKEKRPVTIEEMERIGNEFKWNLKENEIRTGARLLKKLDLIK